MSFNEGVRAGRARPSLTIKALLGLFLFLGGCAGTRPQDPLAREAERAAYAEAGVTDSWEMARWKDLAMGPQEASQWKKNGFRVEEVPEWDRQGFNLTEAMRWKSQGLKAEDAAEWRGHSPLEARELKRRKEEVLRKRQILCPSMGSQQDLIGVIPFTISSRCYEIKAARTRQLVSPNTGIYEIAGGQLLFFDFGNSKAPTTAFFGLARGGGEYAYRMLSGESKVIPGLQVIEIWDQY